MLLKDFYDSIGGNYESVRKRISKDEIIVKYLMKFPSEPSYGQLCISLANEDYGAAFRAAHSLKGISVNLGLQNLSDAAHSLTELLREYSRKPAGKEECTAQFDIVSREYQAVIEAVRKYTEE